MWLRAIFRVAFVYKEKNLAKPHIVTVVLNALLLALVMALGLVALFSMLEIVLTIGAHVIVATMDSATRSKYALVTLRNVWLLGGGAIWLGIIIYCLDYFFKHWRERGIQRRFLKLLALEAAIIVLQTLITG